MAFWSPEKIQKYWMNNSPIISKIKEISDMGLVLIEFNMTLIP